MQILGLTSTNIISEASFGYTTDLYTVCLILVGSLIFLSILHGICDALDKKWAGFVRLSMVVDNLVTIYLLMVGFFFLEILFIEQICGIMPLIFEKMSLTYFIYTGDINKVYLIPVVCSVVFFCLYLTNAGDNNRAIRRIREEIARTKRYDASNYVTFILFGSLAAAIVEPISWMIFANADQVLVVTILATIAVVILAKIFYSHAAEIAAWAMLLIAGIFLLIATAIPIMAAAVDNPMIVSQYTSGPTFWILPALCIIVIIILAVYRSIIQFILILIEQILNLIGENVIYMFYYCSTNIRKFTEAVTGNLLKAVIK